MLQCAHGRSRHLVGVLCRGRQLLLPPSLGLRPIRGRGIGAEIAHPPHPSAFVGQGQFNRITGCQRHIAIDAQPVAGFGQIGGHAQHDLFSAGQPRMVLDRSGRLCRVADAGGGGLQSHLGLGRGLRQQAQLSRVGCAPERRKPVRRVDPLQARRMVSQGLGHRPRQVIQAHHGDTRRRVQATQQLLGGLFAQSGGHDQLAHQAHFAHPGVDPFGQRGQQGGCTGGPHHHHGFAPIGGEMGQPMHHRGLRDRGVRQQRRHAALGHPGLNL